MKHLCFYSLQWNSNVTLGILLHSRSRLGTWEFQIVERLFGKSGTNILFWTCQGHCTCECTVNMVAYTQHTWKQAGSHSIVTWRGTHKVPPIAEELLEIVSCGRRDDHFSGDVVPGRLLIKCGWLYVHAHMGGTNWTLWGVLKEDMKFFLGGGLGMA